MPTKKKKEGKKLFLLEQDGWDPDVWEGTEEALKEELLDRFSNNNNFDDISVYELLNKRIAKADVKLMDVKLEYQR